MTHAGCACTVLLPEFEPHPARTIELGVCTCMRKGGAFAYRRIPCRRHRSGHTLRPWRDSSWSRARCARGLWRPTSCAHPPRPHKSRQDSGLCPGTFGTLPPWGSLPPALLSALGSLAPLLWPAPRRWWLNVRWVAAPWLGAPPWLGACTPPDGSSCSARPAFCQTWRCTRSRARRLPSARRGRSMCMRHWRCTCLRIAAARAPRRLRMLPAWRRSAGSSRRLSGLGCSRRRCWGWWSA